MAALPPGAREEGRLRAQLDLDQGAIGAAELGPSRVEPLERPAGRGPLGVTEHLEIDEDAARGRAGVRCLGRSD